MKLNKESWHYKLTNKIIYSGYLHIKLRHRLVSLCPYVWGVLFACFFVGVIVPVCGITLLGIGLIPFFWWTNSDDMLISAILIGTIEICSLMSFWVYYRTANYGAFFPYKINRIIKQKKSKSLLYARLKAAHDNICPIMEESKNESKN